MNPEKTSVVHFTRRRTANRRPFTIFDEPLQFTAYARYLGVDLDSKLTFQQHIQTVAKKATNRLLAIYPLLRSQVFSIETRLHIYYMLIRSLLTYAAPAWKHAAPSHLILLQRVQNRAARIITGHSRDTRITQLHEDLSLQYLSDFIEHISISFWNRIRTSPHDSLHNIGTAIPIRQTYRMPHP